jgi:hypothetical protein
MAHIEKQQRLRLVIYQESAGRWLAHGLEHDVMAEARTIGGVVRAAIAIVQAHTEFDVRHSHIPLSAFRPAPQAYWSAYASGTPISLDQLGVVPMPGWDVRAAVAHTNPYPCERIGRAAGGSRDWTREKAC